MLSYQASQTQSILRYDKEQLYVDSIHVFSSQSHQIFMYVYDKGLMYSDIEYRLHVYLFWKSRAICCNAINEEHTGPNLFEPLHPMHRCATGYFQILFKSNLWHIGART